MDRPVTSTATRSTSRKRRSTRLNRTPSIRKRRWAPATSRKRPWQQLQGELDLFITPCARSGPGHLSEGVQQIIAKQLFDPQMTAAGVANLRRAGATDANIRLMGATIGGVQARSSRTSRRSRGRAVTCHHKQAQSDTMHPTPVEWLTKSHAGDDWGGEEGCRAGARTTAKHDLSCAT